MLYNGKSSLAAVLAVTMIPSVAWAQSLNADCWRPEEVRAAQIQNLKTTLMTDALKCQDTIPATADSYNSFLNKRHDLVIATRGRVREHFVRLLGPTEGAKTSDEYETRAGNRAASAPIDPQRCETMGVYARLATTAAEEDLGAMADMLAPVSGINVCPTELATRARPARMVIPVWEKKAPAFANLKPAPSPVTVAMAVAPVAALQAPAEAAAAPIIAAVPVAVAAPAPIEAVATVPAPAAFVQPAVLPVADAPKLAEAPVVDRTATLKALQAAAAALAQIAVTLQSDQTPAAPVLARN